VFSEKEQPSSLALAPLEVGYQRELLVNKEKFLTGRAAGLSNGVNGIRIEIVTAEES
jgi:hypothetical protein